MKIIIETIPHGLQRYPTAGDWYWDNEELHIKVSSLGNWRREALISVHELVEVLICKHRGVKQDDVDRFDIEFEKNRPEGNTDEPGDDPRAPYRREHCTATGIERILASELEVDWKAYEHAVESL